MASSFEEMTLLYSRFLRIISILPLDEQGFTSIKSRALFVYWFVFSVLHWNMYVLYALYAINQPGVPKIDTICETVIIIGIWTRYYLLLPRRAEFAAVLEECRLVWYAIDEEDRRVVRHFERKIRRLFLGLLSSCIVINVAYGAIAIVLNVEAVRNANDTHGPQRILPYMWFTPGAEDSWPGYKFNFVLQMVASLNATTTTTTVDAAAPLLIMLNAGYFRALRRRLHRVYDLAMKSNAEDSSVDLELLNCYRLHQRVLSHCARINAIARNLFFVQLMCTGYNTSLIGLKLAGHDPDRLKYIPVVFLNVGQMFICQWAPDHLVDESSAVSTAAYDASFPWMRRRIGKLLVLMIARAQRPVQMTAAGLINLSLENFGAMLKGALSFFTVLRSFDA